MKTFTPKTKSITMKTMTRKTQTANFIGIIHKLCTIAERRVDA